MIQTYSLNKSMYQEIKTYMYDQDGGNVLSCSGLEHKHMSPEDRIAKKKAVYETLLNQGFGGNPDITDLKKQHVKYIFKTIDNIYFDGQISRYLKRKEINLGFKTSEKLTSSAGVCKAFSESKYQIVLSSRIINKIFQDNVNVLNINGVECRDTLECLINLFEHELVHLLVFILCPDLGKGMGGHTQTFKNIAWNIFGHTDYKHMLLSGDYHEYKDKIQKIKSEIKIGSIVTTKPHKGKSLTGYVIKISGKTVKILLKDGRNFNVPYSLICYVSDPDPEFTKIIDNTKSRPVEPESQQIDINALKQKISKNDIIKIRFKQNIVNAKVIAVNEKRLRVELSDGKHWYVLYQSVVQ